MIAQICIQKMKMMQIRTMNDMNNQNMNNINNIQKNMMNNMNKNKNMNNTYRMTIGICEFLKSKILIFKIINI